MRVGALGVFFVGIWEFMIHKPVCCCITSYYTSLWAVELRFDCSACG